MEAGHDPRKVLTVVVEVSIETFYRRLDTEVTVQLSGVIKGYILKWHQSTGVLNVRISFT